MKKINKILALAMPLAMLSSFPVTSAYASDSEHELYLSAEGAEDTETGKIFCLERSMLDDGDYTLKVNIFFRDDVLNAWYVSPKVKCADSNIKLINLVDPKDPLIEFAYAEKDENGELTYGINSTIASGSEKYNTVNFTCMNANIMKRSAMLPYGEFTDSYPLTFFDAVINKDIPTGEYEIYFLREAEDDPDQRVTEVSLMIGGGPEACDVTLTDMKILVGTLGDIDDNGTIDSIDASAILKEYSLTSTQKEPTFSNVQKKFADTDGNGTVDSSDASLVLKYYAYTSTNGKISMPEYIKTLENKNEQSGENSAENSDEDDDPEPDTDIPMAIVTESIPTTTTTVTTTTTTTTTTETTTTTTTTTTEETTTTTTTVTVNPEIYRQAYMKVVDNFVNDDLIEFGYTDDDSKYYAEDLSGDGIPELIITYRRVSGTYATQYYTYNGEEYVLSRELNDGIEVSPSENLIHGTAWEGNEVHYYYSVNKDGSLKLEKQLMYGVADSSYYINGSPVSSNDYYAVQNYYKAFSWKTPEWTEFDDSPYKGSTWQAAYANAVMDFQTGNIPSNCNKYALVYVDDDDIPELWLKNTATDICSLWTYKNGHGYTVHTGEGPRNGFIAGYYPKQNYFATRFFSSVNFYATNVRKINDDGTNTIVSQLLYQDNTYSHNGNTVSESQFNEYMDWVDENFVSPDFVTYSEILQQLK
ncbi:MAG: hypothetical protein IKS03_05800 [Ruminococcus sp.]|nr:hypothetical protein [Ruminococcus sp.]